MNNQNIVRSLNLPSFQSSGDFLADPEKKNMHDLLFNQGNDVKSTFNEDINDLKPSYDPIVENYNPLTSNFDLSKLNLTPIQKETPIIKNRYEQLPSVPSVPSVPFTNTDEINLRAVQDINRSEEPDFSQRAIDLISQINDSFNTLQQIISNFDSCAQQCKAKYSDDLRKNDDNFKKILTEVRYLQSQSNINKKKAEEININTQLVKLQEDYQNLYKHKRELENYNKHNITLLSSLGINDPYKNYVNNINNMLNPNYLNYNNNNQNLMPYLTNNNQLLPRQKSEDFASLLQVNSPLRTPRLNIGYQQQQQIPKLLNDIENVRNKQLMEGNTTYYSDDAINNINDYIARNMSYNNQGYYEPMNEVKLKNTVRDLEHIELDESRYNLNEDNTREALQVLNNVVLSPLDTKKNLTVKKMRDILDMFNYEHKDYKGKDEVYNLLSQLANNVLKSPKLKRRTSSRKSSPTRSPNRGKSPNRGGSPNKKKSKENRKNSFTIEEAENFESNLNELDKNLVRSIERVKKGKVRSPRSQRK